MSTSIFQHHPNTIFIIFTPLHHQPKFVPVSARHIGQPESYYHGEGRVALTDSVPRFQYKLTDHLGNTMVLFEDINGDGIITTESMSSDPAEVEVLQRNFYYAFGLPMQGPWNHTPTDPDMPYLYNGKELEGELGLGWYAYGFRYYDASIGRFVGVDPLADAPLNIGTSPYAYVWNNPLVFIDPDGRHGEGVEDDYVFDENGKFLRVDRNNQPDKIVVENSQTGNVIGSYAFNDPSNDGSMINENTSLIHISEIDIDNQMISNGSATTTENPWIYIERESRPAGTQSLLSGKSTGMLDHAGNPNSLISKSNAFYVVGGTALNDKDFGNFLWGQSGKRLGFSHGTLLTAAHLNNMVNGRSDNPGVNTGVFDSPADQRAISRGYQFPNSYNCQLCGAGASRRPWFEAGPRW
jgi:RHS repeat-associated protein